MSHPRFDAIVFDLDGTLVDSRADLAAAANHALLTHGYPTLSEARIASYVGDGARTLIARAAGTSVAGEQLNALVATFLDVYAAHVCDKTTLMPGAGYALAALSGMPLAVLTNKPSAPTALLLRHLDISKYFRCVIGGGDLAHLKPNPEPLFEIGRRLGVASNRMLMVGDGPQDVECGRNAGASTLGLAGGIADPAQLRAANPDYWLESLAELPRLVFGAEDTADTMALLRSPALKGDN
ncbi:MAG TPA: HAD-IA family hydrolase [Polyangiaceae bacterium]